MKRLNLRDLILGCTAAIALMFSNTLLAEEPVKEINTLVETIAITPRNLTIDSTYIGYLKPVERVIVSADTEGPVERINFREGQFIKQGQILLHIATERLDLKQKIARSNYVSSVAMYDREKKLLDENFQNRQLEVQYQLATSNYELALTNFKKEKQMYEKDISTESRFDTAKNELESARAAMELAKLNWDQSTVISSANKLNELKNQMEVNKYQLELARLDFNRSKVKSPLTGIVSHKKVEKGGFISNGQELLELMDIASVLAQINIPENQIRAIQVNSKVKVMIDAVPDQDFTGIVKTLGLEADQSNRSFPAEIEIENKDQQLLPGMMARVNIEVTTAAKQIIIPRHVVLDRDNTKIVFVEEDGIAKIRHITLGKLVKGEVQVLAGLKYGEKLIVSGQQYLSHNDKVEIAIPSQTKKLVRR